MPTDCPFLWVDWNASLLSGREGPVESEFNEIVRPVVQPRLNEFRTALTSIRQKDVDGADYFPDVLRRLWTWIGERRFTLCSWGSYDLNRWCCRT